jgi:CDP-diglyceride synthetase
MLRVSSPRHGLHFPFFLFLALCIIDVFGYLVGARMGVIGIFAVLIYHLYHFF